MLGTWTPQGLEEAGVCLRSQSKPPLSWGLNRSSPAHDMACAGPSVLSPDNTDQEHAQALARHASGQHACL